MSDKETSICYSEEDLGKNLYRKKTYYTLVIEQDVLANDEDEADRLFQDSGINHEKINTELTEENNGVETYYVDANYTDSGKTEYIGKVNYDPMDDPSFDHDEAEKNRGVSGKNNPKGGKALIVGISFAYMPLAYNPQSKAVLAIVGLLFKKDIGYFLLYCH